MDIRLTKKRADVNSIEAISSKSYVHRLLIAAALCDRKVNILTNIDSNDMAATRGALETIRTGGVIDCGESGSTARFLLPLSALLCDEATLTGSGKLPERPMGPLCDVLRAAGVFVSSDHLPITVKNKPRSGSYEIPGNVSSQFISGLLFMLPLLDGDSELKVTGRFESAAYVDMTLDVLSRFSVRINRTADGFEIPGGQRYICNERDIRAEGDWSNAAYIMAIAALGCGRLFDSLAITGLNPESIQGDRAVIDIFEKFGIEVDITFEDDNKSAGYVIKSGPCRPVDIDCSQIPDLVPALCVIAAFTDGNSRFRNISRLRMKESDRVEAVKKMLAAAGKSVDIISDGADGGEDMVVHGIKGCTKDPITVDSFNDHRIVMAAAAMAAATDADVVIRDAGAVDKSYPGFFEVIDGIGLTGR